MMVGMSTGEVAAYVRRLPWRDVEKPTVVMLWVAGLFTTALSFAHYLAAGHLGADAHAYWLIGQPGEVMYDTAPPVLDSFLYSPAFAQVVWPLTSLPWAWFLAVWIALEVAALAWLFAPLGWRWAVPLVMLCAPEFTIGNVHAFLALLAVLAFRWPGWWTAVFLTKPTLALGPVWFAARGEWRKVAVTVAVTVAVVAASAALWPTAWGEWVAFLLGNSGAAVEYLPLRIAAALAITVYGARTNRAWLVPLAMCLALPGPVGSQVVALLAAIPRLVVAAESPDAGLFRRHRPDARRGTVLVVAGELSQGR